MRMTPRHLMATGAVRRARQVLSSLLVVAMSVGFVATPMTTLAADAPPPNDAFASATPWTTYVPEDPAQFAGTAWTGSLVGASTETGEPGTATRTIWYRVGSTAGGVLALSDNLAAGLSQALYEGTSVDDLTLVPLISDNSGTVWATLEPGNQYQLQVSASAELAAGGLFYLFGQPSNDTFAGARLLGPAGTTQARLLAATREPGEPSPADCASAPKTEWYAITPANASRLDMTLVGPFNPSALATCLTLYEGSSLGGLSQLATATASGGLATIGRNLAAGTTYHIAVAGGSLVNPGRDFPTYGLTWLLSNHPPNDAFASATPWTTYVPEDPAQFAGTAWTGSLVGASTETGEPGTATRTIWYRVGSTAGGVLALSDNLAAGLSQALYEGTSVDDLTLVPLISDNSGTVWATLEPGNQYQLQVSASAELAAGGLFYLFGQPSNDTFAGARLLGPAGTTQARLLAATREPGEPSPADCASAPKTEWYAITPANASRLDMTLVGPFNPSALATCLTLYEGSSLGGLSQLATATASGGLATIGRNLAAGTTYHIAVAGGSLVNPGRDFPTYGLTWLLSNHPPNDAFASATPWTTYVPEDPAQFAGTAWTGSLVGASTETGEPGTATRTIWYRVGSTAGGVLALSDNLAAGLSQALYEGTSVDDLTLVPLISDNSGTVWATLEPGNQYQLQVSASAELAAGGLFYLFGQPSNDTFAGARLLGPAGTTQARLLAATREPGEPSPADCASAPKTEWYAITPANASRLDMTLVGPFNPSALATCLTLYEGSSLGGLSQLATATASGGLATIGRNLAAGTTYHIAVAGGSLVNPGRDFPTYGLTWLLSNHPPNDAFASATPWTTYVPEDPPSSPGRPGPAASSGPAPRPASRARRPGRLRRRQLRQIAHGGNRRASRRAQQTRLVDQRLVQVGHPDRLVRVVEEHAAEVGHREPEHQVAAGGLLRVVADVLQRPLVDVEAAGDVAVEEERLGERQLVVLRAVARLHRHGQALAAAEEVRRLERELAEEAFVLRDAGAERQLIAVLLLELQRDVDRCSPCPASCRPSCRCRCPSAP